jgi:PAS domain S-box-containing protein
MKFGSREFFLALLGALCIGLILVAQQLHTTLDDRSLALNTKAKIQLAGRINNLSSVLLLLSGAQVLCVIILFTLGQRGGSDFKADEVYAALDVLESSRMLRKVDTLTPKDVIAILENLAQELTEAKSIQRFLMERASHVVCIVDKKGKFTSVSKASLSAWGYQSSELEGKNISQVLVDPTRVIQIVMAIANTSKKAVVETNLKARDGEILDVVWTAYWSTSDSALFCIVQDVTERKRVEMRLRTTLEALPAGVIITGTNNIIEFANAKACSLLKWEPGDLLGQSLDDIWEHKYQRNIEELSERVLLNPVFQTQAKRSDDTRFPIEVSTRSIEYAEEFKLLAVFIDITAQKESERLRSEFLAMVTHDMRTPLASLQGMLGLLDKGVIGELNAQGRQLVTSVGPKFDRLLRLISDMLDLEKIGQGKMRLECKTLTLNEVIQNVMSIVQMQAQERNISLQVRMEPCVCWGDRDQLERVVQNLLSNAIKFSDNNSSVVIMVEDLGNEARVSVADNGRGIPENRIDRIFEKFEQVERADAKIRGGTGLGLAICKAIVTEHRGEIGVYNNPGRGSTFWFTVPKTQAAAEATRA